MATPEISVLIPMYNRKHYIAEAINSVLNQTFQNFEIIIRDDGSTDGSCDFVRDKYAVEIASGKIKLNHNEKNIGEFPSVNILFGEATGKYIQILHSDDLLLPHALQHLHEVAEKTNADVVHESFFLNSPPDGIITADTKLIRTCWENNPASQIKIMPNEPLARFKEWIEGGTFIDAQYNIFRREFLVDSGIFINGGNRMMALWWLMMAKVFVKTPVICYVRRDSSDSQTNTMSVDSARFEKYISDMIESLPYMDERLSKIEFFSINEPLKYMAKAHWLNVIDNYQIKRRNIYKNGVTPEIYQAVENVFRKHFGNDYFYPMFLFNMAHVLPYNKPVELIATAPPRWYSLILEAA